MPLAKAIVLTSSVGVSVGNLYRYYPQKEALFDAVTLPAPSGIYFASKYPVKLNGFYIIEFEIEELSPCHQVQYIFPLAPMHLICALAIS
jgi:hypothetical protein